MDIPFEIIINFAKTNGNGCAQMGDISFERQRQGSIMQFYTTEFREIDLVSYRLLYLLALS